MTTKTTAVGNQKGGVGKTTTTLGLAGADAHAGRRCAVFDLDPQRNATSALLGEYDGLNVYDALMSDEPGAMQDVIRPSNWEGIDIAPGHKALALLERSDVMMPEHRLKNALDGVDLSAYDRIYLDLPPQLGRLVLIGLVVADDVLVVTVPEAWAIDGVLEFMGTIDAVRSSRMMNPALTIAGVLANGYSDQRVEHSSRWAELGEMFGEDLVDIRVPRLAAAGNMAAYSAPIYEAKGSNWRRLAACYEMLADQLAGERD
jgi:chromosome partitioning protein